MPRSVAAPTLDYEFPSSWWDSFAEHLSSSLQDSLCSKYNSATEDLRDLVKYHIQKAIGKCPDRYPVIQFQGVDSQQTIPYEKANLLRIIPHGTNGPYSNFPTPDRLFGKDRCMSGPPQLISSPCSTYVTGSYTEALPETFVPNVFGSDPSIPSFMPKFPLEGSSLYLGEELSPLATSSMESGLILTGDVSQIPCGWPTFGQYNGA